ncbi:MAG TPA: MerR family transcriptional regulator [Candidatus Udaeobacter sp.]|nr:MerR family transcriptional regulator [Candidatus Udaeobacter sp.]
MSQTERLLQVGELAERGGKTVRAIHHYEELGLLKPATRSKGGYRLFHEEALTRIRWVGMLQDLGLSLSEVRDWLRELEDKRSAPVAMQEVRLLFQKKLDETRESAARLRTLENELVQSLEYLEACTTCHHEERIAVCGACDQPHSEVRPQLIAGIHGGQTSTS